MEQSARTPTAEYEAGANGAAGKAYLKLAENYIRTHLREPFTLDDLTEAVGTSSSTLLRTFKIHHGVSPMQFVKQIRLKAVRRSLLAAEPENGIISLVAFEFGFRQMGRFSAEYRKVFGELPSETLRV